MTVFTVNGFSRPLEERFRPRGGSGFEKDGRVSHFEVVKPSGIPELDESVAAVAKRVTQVDRLPDGLVSGDHYTMESIRTFS